jgi:hypothetical protein
VLDDAARSALSSLLAAFEEVEGCVPKVVEANMRGADSAE